MSFCRNLVLLISGLTISIVVLFQSGCGQFKKHGRTVSVKLSPDVKLRLVYLDQLKLFVGKYEVCNAEFRCFRPQHSSGTHEGQNLNGDRQPAVNVSWNDAHAFCDWLNKNHSDTPTGKLKYRLPTVKEWETYATCGTGSEFPWGAWPPPKRFNYFGRENRSPGGQMLEHNDGHRVSAPVEKSGDNDWGLYGVGGNVWEWCEDKDEEMPAMRVLKGASWADSMPLFLRTSRNSAYEPTYKYINLGFRVVAEPVEGDASPSAQKDKTSGK